MSDVHDEQGPAIYGLLAEYNTADDLIAGITKVKEAGYTKLDGYSPYPVAGVADALGFKYSEMATIMLCGGVIGAVIGFVMQSYLSAFEYPLNIGGKPLISWPSFIPITFETGILTCALTGVFGLFAICGLPRLHHPLFNVPQFAAASRDKFFMAVEATDPKFDLAATRTLMESTTPVSLAEVPHE